MSRTAADIEQDRSRLARRLGAQAEALAEEFKAAIAADDRLAGELRRLTGRKHPGGFLASLNPAAPWDMDQGLGALVRRLQSARYQADNLKAAEQRRRGVDRG